MEQNYTSSFGVQRVVISNDDRSSPQADGQQPQQYNPDGKGAKSDVSVSRVGDVQRIVVGNPNNEYTERGVEYQQYQHDPAPTSADNDILSTARTGVGAAVNRPLRGDDTVDVGGTRTSVRAAVAAGFLAMDGDGKYYQPGRARGAATSDTAQTEQQSPLAIEQDQQEQQQPAEDTVPDLDPDTHAVAMALNAVDNVTHESALRGVMEKGEVSDHDIAQIATQLGLEPDEAKARVATVRQGYENQARELVGGTNANDIIAWGYEARPQLMQEAISAHVREGKKDAYNDVVRAYLKDLPRSNPDALLNANNASDLGIRRESNGDITINVPGHGRMSFAASVNSGLIGPSPRKRQ